MYRLPQVLQGCGMPRHNSLPHPGKLRLADLNCSLARQLGEHFDSERDSLFALVRQHEWSPAQRGLELRVPAMHELVPECFFQAPK